MVPLREPYIGTLDPLGKDKHRLQTLLTASVEVASAINAKSSLGSFWFLNTHARFRFLLRARPGLGVGGIQWGVGRPAGGHFFFCCGCAACFFFCLFVVGARQVHSLTCCPPPPSVHCAERHNITTILYPNTSLLDPLDPGDTIGASTIRIGLWGPSYYTYTKYLPK